MHNLLDNAIKYCKEVPIVEVQTLDQGNLIELKVIDEGIGIEQEAHGKVFNKFYRISTGNVHNVKGFGLGLFYVKNICNAHGWKIKLDSTPDVGTTISIKIPKG